MSKLTKCSFSTTQVIYSQPAPNGVNGGQGGCIPKVVPAPVGQGFEVFLWLGRLLRVKGFGTIPTPLTVSKKKGWN